MQSGEDLARPAEGPIAKGDPGAGVVARARSLVPTSDFASLLNAQLMGQLTSFGQKMTEFKEKESFPDKVSRVGDQGIDFLEGRWY